MSPASLRASFSSFSAVSRCAFSLRLPALAAFFSSLGSSASVASVDFSVASATRVVSAVASTFASAPISISTSLSSTIIRFFFFVLLLFFFFSFSCYLGVLL